MIESDIHNALSGNATVARKVGARIYPLVMPQKPELPAVTYHCNSADPVNDLRGYSGLMNSKVRVNAFATRYDTAKELAEDVHLAMNGATAFKSICLNDLDGFDQDTNLFFVTQDFSCWGT